LVQELLEHPWLSGAAPDLALGSTLSALKGFNARNRLKNAVNGVIVARRMQLIMSSMFEDRQAVDFSRNYSIQHVHRLCGTNALHATVSSAFLSLCASVGFAQAS